MKSPLPLLTNVLFLAFGFAALPLKAAELPTGQATPEGVACDAVMAYINRDSKAWLATLVRPIYGKSDEEYEKFKKQMVDQTDQAKEDKTLLVPRLVKCFKARPFSMNGPGSAAFALFEFNGNMFVDLEVEMEPGKTQILRYHVLLDKDKKWLFEPRPDLNPLISMGLNKESDSKEVFYEAKAKAKGQEKTAPAEKKKEPAKPKPQSKAKTKP